LRMTLGSQDGISAGKLPRVLMTTEMSVNVKASQVITPTVKRRRIMAFVRTKRLIFR
jgi:hypothetical protein